MKQEKNEQSWNQWLAGLIDGDGCLLVSNKGYTSLEITMGILDEHALAIIKQELGGSVKLRSGSRAFRYRLHDRKGMITLIKKINGFIRHPNRVVQLKAVCEKFDFFFKTAPQLTLNDGWFAGFFDADGTISIRKGEYPQLTISVSQKTPECLIPFQEIFGGRIGFDKAANVYKWDLDQKEKILFFCNYTKNYPIRSHKKKRLLLINKYFSLRSALPKSKANSYNELLKTRQAWENFLKDWEDD